MSNNNEHLNLPSPAHILRCIEEWRSYDLRKLSDVEIDANLVSFLDSLGEYVLTTKRKTVPCLWRIRSMDYLLKSESELWEPPVDKTPMGRCNAEKNPVLYTSLKLKTPFEELKVKPDEPVYLIKYKQRTPLNLRTVVLSDKNTSISGRKLFDDQSFISHLILRDFIRSEFLKPVGKGTEFLHRISASMTRTWFDDDDIDGWLYPSVHSVNDLNIALKPNVARSKLEIDSVRIAKMVDKKSVAKSNISASKQPLFNMMKMVIKSDFKAEIKEDGLYWFPCNELGGDF
ncbi:RES domain-containing protein [Verrucomicrobia bacterium S94]|nr:RES domain-containing protein [Verrucomicrobia bacterium S94]